MRYSLKQKIGVIIFGLPGFLWSLRPGWFLCGKARPWCSMRNRNGRLIVDPAGRWAGRNTWTCRDNDWHGAFGMY